jgi:hypothetical protein
LRRWGLFQKFFYFLIKDRRILFTAWRWWRGRMHNSNWWNVINIFFALSEDALSSLYTWPLEITSSFLRPSLWISNYSLNCAEANFIHFSLSVESDHRLPFLSSCGCFDNTLSRSYLVQGAQLQSVSRSRHLMSGLIEIAFPLNNLHRFTLCFHFII